MDRDLREPFRQYADTGPKLAEFLRLAPRAFGKQDNDGPVFQRRDDLGQHDLLGLTAAHAQRNDAHDPQGEPGQPAVAQKIIGGGHRPDARQQPQGQQRHQHRRVQVAVVIGHDDGRSTDRQPLPAADVEPQHQEQDRSDDQREKQQAEQTMQGSEIVITGEMEKQRRRIGEAVHPVQNPAMAGQQRAAVLDAQIALQG